VDGRGSGRAPFIVVGVAGARFLMGPGYGAAPDRWGDPGHRTRETSPTKTKPDNPAAWRVPHQDKLVYERLRNAKFEPSGRTAPAAAGGAVAPSGGHAHVSRSPGVARPPAPGQIPAAESQPVATPATPTATQPQPAPPAPAPVANPRRSRSPNRRRKLRRRLPPSSPRRRAGGSARQTGGAVADRGSARVGQQTRRFREGGAAAPDRRRSDGRRRWSEAAGRDRFGTWRIQLASVRTEEEAKNESRRLAPKAASRTGGAALSSHARRPRRQGCVLPGAKRPAWTDGGAGGLLAVEDPRCGVRACPSVRFAPSVALAR